jgi:hypothetical protein
MTLIKSIAKTDVVMRVLQVFGKRIRKSIPMRADCRFARFPPAAGCIRTLKKGVVPMLEGDEAEQQKVKLIET